MGVSSTGMASVLTGALVLGCSLLAGAPAAAQSFAGMSMLDLETQRDDFFYAADGNGDFALSTEEQLNALTSPDVVLFECWDSDGDGLCAYSEFLDSGLRLFQSLDRDGDGRLSLLELQ
jgi:hypothetical protein